MNVGERVLAETVDAFRDALGDRLLAAYALGSLAHGGFSPLVSDIDMCLVVRDPLRSDDAETIQAVTDTQKANGSELSNGCLSSGPPSPRYVENWRADAFPRSIGWT